MTTTIHEETTKPPACRSCDGQDPACDDCCGLGVDCIDWHDAILYERARAEAAEAENARLRSSLAFFAARFLAVAPRHEGSGEAT